MARILVTDGMANAGIEQLIAAGHDVTAQSMTPDELLAAISDYDALVVRSATVVTPAVLAAGAPRLKVVGRAGVGVDNIDLAAATQHGVIVMNAPLGNILSAAEHTLGMLFAVARNIPQAHQTLANGAWNKKAFIGVELQGKKLGIIGLGKIGKHVATVAQAAGMEVIAHDPFLSHEVAQDLRITPVDLDQLFADSDFMTFHVPLTDKTRNMLNAETMRQCKPSLRVINVSRGGVIDEAALAEALNEGTIAAAALDVFAEEPLADDNPLRACKNCILTPHLGASTEEAQVRVSTDIAEGFCKFFDDGTIVNAVNVQLKVDPAISDYLIAAERLAGLLAQTIDKPLRGLELRARGELAKYDVKPLSVAALKGALSQVCDQQVNLINAQVIAEERGVTLTTSSTEQLRDNQSRLAIRATTRDGESRVGGTVVDGQLRLLRFNDYPLDLPIDGHLLILEYRDRPGMVGRYGSILGENHINIARMEVSRIDGRGAAMVVLTLDDPLPPAVLQQIKDAVEPDSAFTASF